MASGEARETWERTGRKVAILGADGRHRRHPAWDGNPKIARQGEDLSTVEKIVNGPNARPYIKRKLDDRWVWKEWDCPRGELYLTDRELKPYAGMRVDVVIEPWTKGSSSPNKAWPAERWAELVRLLSSAGLDVVQLGDHGTRVLPGTRHILTPTMRHACAALTRAKAAVLHEGGLHHSAAAVGTRAVVLFGGFISPHQTGYAMHRNIFTGGEPCGMRIPCEHCAKAMAAIEPEQVFEELTAIIEEGGKRAEVPGSVAA